MVSCLCWMVQSNRVSEKSRKWALGTKQFKKKKKKLGVYVNVKLACVHVGPKTIGSEVLSVLIRVMVDFGRTSALALCSHFFGVLLILWSLSIVLLHVP